MNQEDEIIVKFKESTIKGNKAILSYNASKIIDKCKDNEIVIQESEFKTNIHENTFIIFIKSSFGEDIRFDSGDAFELQYLCNFFGNKSLFSDIEEFIKLMPEIQIKINRYKFDKDEDSLRFLGDNFPECIKYHDFMEIDPNTVVTDVFSSDEFQKKVDSEDFQHSIVRYLVNIHREEKSINDINSVLSHIKYELLSSSDIKDLINYYHVQIPENISASIRTISEIIAEGDETIANIRDSLTKMKEEKDKELDEIQSNLEKIKQDEEKAFSYENDQRNRVYAYKVESENIQNIEARHESIKEMHEEVLKYQARINKSFELLENRLTELETTFNKIDQNSNV
ncbi:hypothetical protein M9Y10_004717 [Tritrichomonas musculus]|uniref:BACK domain-containing protein n=1 Tax=Tritrichomonas musculus TaxID=1915356 RepID=A0ABR2JJC6_9EUKA